MFHSKNWLCFIDLVLSILGSQKNRNPHMDYLVKKYFSLSSPLNARETTQGAIRSHGV